jgi:hypothetical protein
MGLMGFRLSRRRGRCSSYREVRLLRKRIEQLQQCQYAGSGLEKESYCSKVGVEGWLVELEEGVVLKINLCEEHSKQYDLVTQGKSLQGNG